MSPKAKTKSLSAADFVHLHNHTQYSLLDGLTKVPDLIVIVKKMGMEAVAVTDHGTLSGLIEFYKEAKAQGIKPVFGMEAYVAARRISDKDPIKDKIYYHLTLLAMNNTGYQNLIRLSTLANLEGLYYKPRIDHELLERYGEGLIVLSGCIGGEVSDALRQNQYDQAKQTAQWYQSIFGDRYYLEVQDHGHIDHPAVWEEQVKVTELTMKLGRELDIDCVVTCDAHYLQPADQDAHELLLCVQTAAFLADKDRMTLKDFHLHVTEPKDLLKRWSQKHPELIRNSRRIADRCQVELELGRILIPKFPVPKSETERSYLEKLVYRGLAWRYGGQTEKAAAKLEKAAAKKLLPKAVQQRADYELGVIESMNFSSFYLIVADFVGWGKQQGIVFGPGRGSAAASIVSYALKITELDPLHYNLVFERFLNPERISMPDFDIDIQDNRRDDVIAYCTQKYGEQRVANIVTFGRMAARNAVRDVARVLQVPYSAADRLAKMIPPPIQGRHIPLAKSLSENHDLKQEYLNQEQSKQVFDLAMQLEGTIRSHGVHAAGVVIAPDDIVKYAPLEMAQKGVIATQYSMGPIEDLGLLKIDFLGLSNLTIIKNALRIIKKVYGQEIDIGSIPLDDKKTFELLSRADTTGVFQLESAGMKRYLKQLRPNAFDDIIAMVALYRPGPMAEIPRFIQGKNDAGKVQYPHPLLEPILKDTYGVMVYQEQIIAMLQLIAGYSPGQADIVRKAIGKKKRDIMAAEEPKFIEGCLKRGLTKQQAAGLWALIQPFADYSFNKAHAACYGLIAYQTAYLKAHYPAAFMAALMTSDFDNTDRLSIEINECKHIGIAVLPPDINESFSEFAVVPETNQIRFGMNAIKNVGTAAAEEILRARREGRFKSLEDFFRQVSPRAVNRKALESLIKAGAFDQFGSRSQLLHNLDALLAYANKVQKEADIGQTDLFGESGAMELLAPKLSLQDPPLDYAPNEQLAWERELLGLYLSHHPLSQYEAFLQSSTKPLNTITPDLDGKSVVVGGMISGLREITTKNGQRMAFVKLADQFDERELLVFPSVYNQSLGLWERDKVIIAKGRVTARDRDGSVGDEAKVLVNDVRELSPEEGTNSADRPKKPGSKRSKNSSAKTDYSLTNHPDAGRRLYIRLQDSADQRLLTSLKQTIDVYQGDTEVVLVVGVEQKQVIRLPMKVSREGSAIEAFQALVGESNVKFQ